MTIAAAPGLRRDKQHHYFYGELGPLPSVTTIIKSLDRSGPLVGWAKRATAECAVRNLDMLISLIATGGADAAIDWLKGIPDYERDKAADLGTAVHLAAESVARGNPLPAPQPGEPDIGPYVVAYQRFIAYTKPRFTLVEAMVASTTHNYGGTLDIGAELFGDGVPTLLDIKTGGVYAEVALQFAGYANADFTGTPDDPGRYPLPRFGRFAVVQLRADGGWSLIPYEVGDREWQAFLSCLELHRWSRDWAPWVKGQPFSPQQP